MTLLDIYVFLASFSLGILYIRHMVGDTIAKVARERYIMVQVMSLSLSSRHFKSVCFNWLLSLSLSLYHGLGKSSLDVQVNTSTFLPFCSRIRELFLSSHALELLRVRSMHQLRSLFLPFSSRLELISLSFGEFCSNMACTNYDDFVSYEKFKHICSSHFS